MINQPVKRLRAAIYLRVSTDEQSKDGYGLAYQEEKNRAFIASQDYILNESHVYRDEGYSGTLPVEERPGLKSLMEAASRKEFDVVLVYRLDRLFRKIILLLSTVEKLSEYEVGFRSITEPFDTSSHFGRYILASLGALAELERDVIKERMTSGRIMAAKTGKWVLGQVPYGYKLDKKIGRLKIIPEEAQWVRKFFDWLVNERMGLQTITKRVNDLGVPTASSAKHRKSNRPVATYWHKRVINRIVTNETYGGTFYFRKYEKKKKLRPEEEWVPIPVPPIVAPEMIELAKAQLQRNREFSARRSKNLYLYGKLVYCGSCGLKLVAGAYPPNKSTNNICKVYKGIHSSAIKYQRTTKRCKWCGECSEKRLEPIWEAIVNLLNNPTYVLNKLQKYTDRGIDRSKLRERLSEINQEIQNLTERRKRLDIMYVETRRIDYAEYRRKLSGYDEQEQKLALEQAEISRKLDNKNFGKERAVSLRRLQREIGSKIKNPTYAQKTEIIHILINKITLFSKSNEAEVVMNLSKTTDNNQKLEDLLRPTLSGIGLADSFVGQSPKILLLVG